MAGTPHPNGTSAGRAQPKIAIATQLNARERSSVQNLILPVHSGLPRNPKT